jgi:hypothetical protein
MSESVIPAVSEPTPEAAPTVAPEAPAAAPATVSATNAAPRAEAIDVLLGQWVVEFLHDSPVSRATEAMNHFTTTALPALRQRLLSEV